MTPTIADCEFSASYETSGGVRIVAGSQTSDFRQFELGPPPVDQVLAELRERFNQGEKHLHADHQIPIEKRPDLRLSLDNLRTRCNGCHGAKTMRELRES